MVCGGIEFPARHCKCEKSRRSTSLFHPGECRHTRQVNSHHTIFRVDPVGRWCISFSSPEDASSWRNLHLHSAFLLVSNLFFWSSCRFWWSWWEYYFAAVIIILALGWCWVALILYRNERINAGPDTSCPVKEIMHQAAINMLRNDKIFLQIYWITHGRNIQSSKICLYLCKVTSGLTL